MDQKWVTIYGNSKISENEIELAPVPQPPEELVPNNIPSAPHCYVRSNIEFEQGTISLEVEINEPKSICQIGISDGQNGQIFAGLNAAGNSYGFAKFLNNKWEFLDGSGQGNNIEIGKWHKLRLHVQGSNIDLFFNDVKVATTNQQIQKGPINLLLQGIKEVTVRNITIEQKPPICFVVMQFTEEYNALYKEVICPTCETFKYKVVRADDFYTSGSIIDDITRSIQEATIIIADITPNNPNVFYELGYAHGIKKPTILLSDRNRDKLPFDISGFRTIFYDNTIGGKNAIEERLKKHLENIGS